MTDFIMDEWNNLLIQENLSEVRVYSVYKRCMPVNTLSERRELEKNWKYAEHHEICLHFMGTLVLAEPS